MCSSLRWRRWYHNSPLEPLAARGSPHSGRRNNLLVSRRRRRCPCPDDEDYKCYVKPCVDTGDRCSKDSECCDGSCFEMKNGKATCEKSCPDDSDYKCWVRPTRKPTLEPTKKPRADPTRMPTEKPQARPTKKPTQQRCRACSRDHGSTYVSQQFAVTALWRAIKPAELS